MTEPLKPLEAKLDSARADLLASLDVPLPQTMPACCRVWAMKTYRRLLAAVLENDRAAICFFEARVADFGKPCPNHEAG